MFTYVLTAILLASAAFVAIAFGDSSTPVDIKGTATQQISAVLFDGQGALARNIACLQNVNAVSQSPSANALTACSVASVLPALTPRAASSVSLVGCLSNYGTVTLASGLDKEPVDATSGSMLCSTRLQVTQAMFVPAALAGMAGARIDSKVFPASSCTSDCDVALAGAFAKFWRSEVGSAVSYGKTVVNGTTYYVLLKHAILSTTPP